MLHSKVIIFRIRNVIIFVIPQLGVEGPLTNKQNQSVNSQNCEFFPIDPCHWFAFLVAPIVRGDVCNYIITSLGFPLAFC